MYNTLFIEKNKNKKFERLARFVQKIDNFMEWIREQSEPIDDKHSVMVTMIKVLYDTFMRIGKDEHVYKNDTYGLCTLLKSHVKLKRNGLCIIKFKAKSN